uniref:Secreted protein n=1 Tax=Strongyloides papillosus TaxID=174720 RepID=A0A0N5BJR8_STREA
MIFVRSLLTLTIIFVSNIVETRFPFNSYETAVTGIPKCGFVTNGFASIFITEDSRSARRSRPIAGTIARYGKAFYIFAGIRKFWRTRLFITIAHKCTNRGHACDQVIVREIPRRFIVKEGQYLNVFMLRVFELSTLQPDKKNCIKNRRGSLLPLLQMPETRL